MNAVKNNAFIRVRLAGIVPGVRNADTLEELVGEIYSEKPEENAEKVQDEKVPAEKTGKKKDSNKRYCADNNSYVEAF